MRIPTIIDSRTNNFDFLRLFAAFLVFLGHAILITRGTGLLYWDRGLIISATGVNIFFIISGFLITKSWLDSNSLFFFTIKRFLRVYPALIAAGLFTVLIIGPITTLLTTDNYFHNVTTFNYLRDIFLLNLLDLNTNVLPGVFVLNKLPLIVNASLWTIPVEVGFYIFVTLLGLNFVFNKRVTLLYILAFLLIYGIATSLKSDFFLFFKNNSNIPYSDIIRLLTYFVFGMVIYLYRESISITKNHFIFLSLILFGSIFTGYFELISYFFLPIFVITIALINHDFPKKFTHYGDFSYGFYLFAFPIQQTVSSFSAGKLLFAEQFIISLILTMFLAVLSWHFIERPCLNFKHSFFISHLKKISCKKTIR